MLNLPNVTLICVTGVNYLDAKYALWRSQRGISFGCVKLIAGSQTEGGRYYKVERATGTALDSIDEYNRYMIYELWKHVDTDFALVVQADGYVLDPKCWQDEFLRYDYIGAPWPISPTAYLDPFGNHVRVGNGGFSLRSRKLLEVPKVTSVTFDVNSSSFYKHMGAGLLSEDGNICVHNRHIYEQQGCIFAPFSAAVAFSKETRLQENRFKRTFGFHKRLPLSRAICELLLKRRFTKKVIHTQLDSTVSHWGG